MLRITSPPILLDMLILYWSGLNQMIVYKLAGEKLCFMYLEGICVVLLFAFCFLPMFILHASNALLPARGPLTFCTMKSSEWNENDVLF